MSLYYTRYSESVVLFKSFQSQQILKIDGFGSSLVSADSFDHYNYYFSTFRKNIDHCLGIVGVLNLATVKYVIVAKGASVVTRIASNTVYTLGDCEFVPVKLDAALEVIDSASDDKHYLSLIKHHLDSASLLYCSTLDISNNFQSLAVDPAHDDVNKHFFANISSKNPHKLGSQILSTFNAEYFWNKHLLTELLELGTAIHTGVADFVIPLIYGFAEFTKLSSSNANDNRLLYFGVISRRSKYRAGTRYFKRGVDAEGNVANFNETEQIVILKQSDEQIKLQSFLQLRGSIPVHWAEINTLQYKPILAISKNSNIHSSVLHFKSITNKFPGLEKVHIVNLINSSGHEAAIKKVFESTVLELANDTSSDTPEVAYTYFDFHQECKKLQYENLSILIDKLRNQQLRPSDYFSVVVHGKGLLDSKKDHVGPLDIILQIDSVQNSVIRTNCMDCLDRTNVVQSMFGKWILGEQLNRLKFNCHPKLEISDLESRSTIAFAPSPSAPTFTLPFNIIWTNNGNSVSRAYSGTGALKSGLTKTGKRTVDGALKDLINSIVRYFKNNFTDGHRQDSFDLFLGKFQPSLFNNSTDYKKHDSRLANSANGHVSQPSVGSGIAAAMSNGDSRGHKTSNSVSVNRYSTSSPVAGTLNYGQYNTYYGLHHLYYPSNINMGSSPFNDSRPFRYQLMPYLLLSTTALFFAVIFFPKDDSVFTNSNMLLLGACFLIVGWCVRFIIQNGLQYVTWPKLCELEYLRKKRVVAEPSEPGDDGVEGFEYVIAEDFTTGLAKLD